MTCTCGHDKDEHGHNDEFPDSTECNECEPGDCIAFEWDGGDADGGDGEDP